MNTRIFSLWLVGLSMLLTEPTPAATITVNTVTDSAAGSVCSLRSAILTANGTQTGGCAAGSAGQDNIIFIIQPLDGSVKILQFASPLPAITSSVVLNALIANDATPNTDPSGSNAQLTVQLDGTGVNGPGLQVDPAGSGTSIAGLVIVNFGGAGILINGADDVFIRGNFIGVAADGSTGAGNGGGSFQGGIRALASGGQSIVGLRIGATIPEERNVISGNQGPGIALLAFGAETISGSQIFGNLIGTQRDGIAGLGNNGRGVLISGATGTQLGVDTEATAGGACTGGCNVIAANFGQIEIGQGTSVTGSNLRANHVGVNALGTAGVTSSFPNTLSALIISQATGSVNIGGAGVRDGNVFSGATSHGVDIQNATFSASITLRSNRIGTNSAGTAAVPNGADGVHVLNTDGVQIGDLSNINLISGNGQNGISLEGSSDTVIIGNRIGTQIDGVSALGNGARGIFLSAGSALPNNNRIGAQSGSTSGGNIIAFNGASSAFSAGVSIQSGTGNRVSRNSIFSNKNLLTGRGLGIDLQGDGVTANDSCDADTGANNLQNFPVNLSATSNAVSGQLRSVPGDYEVEVYATPLSANSVHLAEGKTFLASTSVNVFNNVSCPGAFSNIATTIPVPAGHALTAIAIDSQGNTSEFTPFPALLFFDGFE